MKIGDVVYVPCEVVGFGNMAYTDEAVIDVVLYKYGGCRAFSIFAKDAVPYLSKDEDDERTN